MNKASGGDAIPAKLFQVLKDDAVKVLPSICQQIWKTQQLPQDWKKSVLIPIPKKGNAKECSILTNVWSKKGTIHCSSHLFMQFYFHALIHLANISSTPFSYQALYLVLMIPRCAKHYFYQQGVCRIQMTTV